jgi:hypothetical protein
MGRGRQKAKATRVARDLKYSGPEMDLDRLAKELHGEAPVVTNQSEEDPYEDNYAQRA